MPETHPTNIFDLPLELRQQIYRECVADEWTMHLNDDSVTTVEGLRKADSAMAAEFFEEESRVSRIIHFLVTPAKEWTAPPPISTSTKSYMVKIEFDLSPYIEPSKDFRVFPDYHLNEQLSAMTITLRSFVRWIERSEIHIDHLDICFRHSDYPSPQWCKQHFHKWRGTHLGYSMATRRTRMCPEGEPVLEVLLQPLFAFPVVDVADVGIFGALTGQDVLWFAGYDILHDFDYMWAVCDAWEDWLRGKRDVPVHQQAMNKLIQEKPDRARLIRFY